MSAQTGHLECGVATIVALLEEALAHADRLELHMIGAKIDEARLHAARLLDARHLEISATD